MRYRISIQLFFLLLTVSVLHAQQDAMFTRYMFNSMYLFNNPAYSGTHGHWTTNALYRTQWVNFEGAPQTMYLGAEGMLNQQQNAGLGFSMSYDKVGLDRLGDFSANYAYHIRLNPEGQRLAFGIKAGALFYRAALSEASVWDPDDPVYSSGDIKGLIPKAGLGAFWYGEDHFLGFSIPTLVAIDNRKNASLNINNEQILKRHYYLYGGYVFHLPNDISLKPSLLLKYQSEAPLQADINMNVWLGSALSVGASYRTSDAISVMIEVPLTSHLRIGYAYDSTISVLQNVSSGTHELMVGYNFLSGDHNPWDGIRPINHF